MLLKQPFQFFAVGDVVTEPFIRLKDAEVHCRMNEDGKEICMRYGDKIPYESSTPMPAVGNAANAAVAAARLGLTSSLRAYVGDDEHGEECKRALQENGVDTSFIETEVGKKTNQHYVLWYGSERTILVKHESFTYSVPELSEAPEWIYLSSLAENSLPYHQAIAKYLEAHPETKLALQPGTFQMKLGYEALRPLYERCAFFVVNVQEAQRILGETTDDIRVLLTKMHALGPEVVAITDGTNGACAFDGNRMLRVPMYPDTRGPFERTGAGDAFASTIVSALALGEPLERALLWGPINSMAVVQEVGAQRGLLTREQLETFLRNAPSAYTITEL